MTKTMVVFGDSIVAGWGVGHSQSYPSLLEKHINEARTGRDRWRVVNAGIPGNTVMMGCLRYERDVKPFEPDMLLIAFGLNDAALRRTIYDAQREQLWRAEHSLRLRLLLILRHMKRSLLRRLGGRPPNLQTVREAKPRVSPSFFQAGLSDLVRRGRRAGARVHLLPLTPVLKSEMSSDQWRAYKGYKRLISEVAQRWGIPLIPLDDSDGEPFSHESMLAGDGVHLLATGQSWLASRVYSHLQSEKEVK